MILGFLLLDFFDFYGNKFDYQNKMISVLYEGAILPKPEKFRNSNNPDLLSIEDPTDPNKDAGRFSYDILNIKRLFQVAYEELLKNNELSSMIDYDPHLQAYRTAIQNIQTTSTTQTKMQLYSAYNKYMIPYRIDDLIAQIKHRTNYKKFINNLNSFLEVLKKDEKLALQLNTLIDRLNFGSYRLLNPSYIFSPLNPSYKYNLVEQLSKDSQFSLSINPMLLSFLIIFLNTGKDPLNLVGLINFADPANLAYLINLTNPANLAVFINSTDLAYLISRVNNANPQQIQPLVSEINSFVSPHLELTPPVQNVAFFGKFNTDLFSDLFRPVYKITVETLEEMARNINERLKNILESGTLKIPTELLQSLEIRDWEIEAVEMIGQRRGSSRLELELQGKLVERGQGGKKLLIRMSREFCQVMLHLEKVMPRKKFQALKQAILLHEALEANFLKIFEEIDRAIEKMRSEGLSSEQILEKLNGTIFGKIRSWMLEQNIIRADSTAEEIISSYLNLREKRNDLAHNFTAQYDAGIAINFREIAPILSELANIPSTKVFSGEELRLMQEKIDKTINAMDLSSEEIYKMFRNLKTAMANSIVNLSYAKEVVLVVYGKTIAEIEKEIKGRYKNMWGRLIIVGEPIDLPGNEKYFCSFIRGLENILLEIDWVIGPSTMEMIKKDKEKFKITLETGQIQLATVVAGSIITATGIISEKTQNAMKQSYPNAAMSAKNMTLILNRTFWEEKYEEEILRSFFGHEEAIYGMKQFIFDWQAELTGEAKEFSNLVGANEIAVIHTTDEGLVVAVKTNAETESQLFPSMEIMTESTQSVRVLGKKIVELDGISERELRRLKTGKLVKMLGRRFFEMIGLGKDKGTRGLKSNIQNFERIASAA